jgi:hypothetical protein
MQILRQLNVLSKGNSAIEVVDRDRLASIANFDGHYLDVSRLVSNWTIELQPPV